MLIKHEDVNNFLFYFNRHIPGFAFKHFGPKPHFLTCVNSTAEICETTYLWKVSKFGTLSN